MSDFLNRQFERRARVAVFGDAMIDEYHDVGADRVSPEFPIPVMLADPNRPPHLVPGGAGNVCSQFSNFNFDVDLFSIVDQRFRDSFPDLRMHGCMDSNRPIPVKSRFYSGNFPLFRLDRESRDCGLSGAELREVQKSLVSSLIDSDPYEVVVFSDYDKGVFSGVDPFLERIPDSTITIVDPKAHPIERWAGCTIIKPNSSEAKAMSGREDWREQCEYFMRKTRCQAVVITQAGEGVVGNVMGSWFEYRPEFKGRPVSVIGAGDTFVAFLAMCMAHSIDIRVGVEVAFRACSVYVGKSRNHPVFPYEIEDSKVISPHSLLKRDFRLAFTNGCFDILHPGHLELFRFARERGDRLAVGVNTDASVAKQRKSHPLINDLAHRCAMLSGLKDVDFVLSFDDETPYELIKAIRPEILVKGSDWPSPIGSDIVGEVCSFGLVGGHSTSGIIEKIRSLGPR